MKGDELAAFMGRMKAIVGVEGGGLFYGRANDQRLLFAVRDGQERQTEVKIERSSATALRDWLVAELARP